MSDLQTFTASPSTLALLALLLCHTATAATSPAPTPACTASSPAGAFDLAVLGEVRYKTPDGWTYLFSACLDVDARAVSAETCSGVPPAPAVQVTGRECHALGRLAQRSVAPLADDSGAGVGVGVGGGRVGVTVTFSGGGACGAAERTILIDIICADVARASKAQVIESTARSCAYRATVESRAGCPLACGRDPKTGAVCGGKRRGACTAATTGGAAACVCADGYEGLLCEPTAKTVAAEAASAAAATSGAGKSPAPDSSTSISSILTGSALAAALGAVLLVAVLVASRVIRHSSPAQPTASGPGIGARGASLFLVLGALLYALAADSQFGLFRGATISPSRLSLVPVASAAGVGFVAPPPGSCSVRPQRLAIFNAAPYHTDVFGFLLDYCRDCNHTCAIYHGPSAFSALPAYSRYYAPLDLRDASRFEGEQRDFAAVFMITPNHNGPLSVSTQQAEVHRFIYLTHLTVPGFVMRWMLLRIYTTPLAGVPFALPFFAGRALIPAAERERSVVFVGSIHSGENVLLSDVGAVSGRLVELGFAVTLFASNIRASDADNAAFRINGGAKAVIREGVNTDELHEAVGRASFLLLFPSEYSWYLMDRVTGAHLMAVGLGTPILTTSRFASIYGLDPETSGTVSGDGPAEMAEAVAQFDTPVKRARLVAAAAAYRTQQVRHNREAIESVLQYVPGIGGSGTSATLPLSEQFKQRIIPRAGDP